MTNETQTTKTENEVQADELTVLKQRAKLMGVTHSNNITVEKLREKINAKLAEELTQDEQDEGEDAPADENADAEDEAPEAFKPAKKLTKMQLRQQIIKEQTKLVRIRIANLDPKKKELPGEFITVANGYMGTIKKYVPFGEVTDNGYHVPYCIYKMLDRRRFLDIRTKRDPRTGAVTPQTRYVKEFALEVLPQLTEAELARLANAQAAAGTIGTDD